MSAELIVGIAVGAPATLIAIFAYVSGRTDRQRQADRQLVTDMLAPLSVRITNLEDDMRGHRHD